MGARGLRTGIVPELENIDWHSDSRKIAYGILLGLERRHGNWLTDVGPRKIVLR
jgi:hypothetical protein